MAERPFVKYATHTLYRPGLSNGMTVVDLGANHGAFRRDLLVDFPNGAFHGIEPNPRLLPELDGYITVQPCAVTTSDTTVALQLAENDEASSLLDLPQDSSIGATAVGTVKVPGRRIESILDEIPGPLHVVKVDIEGAEVDVLPTIPARTLGRIGQLTIEFHRDPMFNFDLDQQTRNAIEFLTSSGFATFSFRESDMDVLCVSRERFPISPGQERRWKAKIAAARGFERMRVHQRHLRGRHLRIAARLGVPPKG